MADGDIPWSTLTAKVRQFRPPFPYKVMSELFDSCFPLFVDLDRAYARNKDQLTYRITAAGTEYNFGSRPRRFSGGPGLAPNSYFTVCGDGRSDGGTLRNELTAYYAESSTRSVVIIDPSVDEGAREILRRRGFGGFDVPFMLIAYGCALKSETESSAPAEGMWVTYGVREEEVALDRVVDLRLPETQQWFVETFVPLEVAGRDAVAKRTGVSFLSCGEPPRTFAEMIPVVISPELGGGMMFSQAVGIWMRQHSASGLVFPSARSNAKSTVRDGVLTDSEGWNLVRYAQISPPVVDDMFGSMSTWSDRDHDHIRVRYELEGPNRASLRVRGACEYNLIAFHLRRQIASGIREAPAAGDRVTGSWSASISSAVRDVLDAEAKRRDIWSHDVDYVRFLGWLDSG